MRVIRRPAVLIATAAALAGMVSVANGAVTFGGASSATVNNGASVTVTTPSGAGVGNGTLLLAQVSTGATAPSITATGWTLVGTSTSGSARQSVYRRLHDGSTGSYAFTTSASTGIVATIAAYNGFDSATPIEAATAATGTGTTATSNVMGASTDAGSRVVGFVTVEDNPTVTLSGPVSPGATTRGGDRAEGSAKVIASVADFEQPSTGTNAIAFGWTVSQANKAWVARQIVVRQGGGGVIATAPAAPQSAAGTAGDTRVTVSWAVPSSNGGAAITRYDVTASPGGATCFTTGALSCDVTGLTNGQAYTFTVTATNSVGTGPASSASAAVTPQASPSPSPGPGPGPVPGAPRTVRATAGDASASVSWQRPTGAGASSITAYVATASPGGRTCTTTGLSCAITGLDNGRSYTVAVVARNSSGDGPASDASPAFTPTAPAAPTAGRKSSDDNRPRPKVTICHATKSATNPYVAITVDPNSIITQGHDQHQDGRDIIPAFTYDDRGTTVTYPGKNLDARGLALLANGCKPSTATSVTAALIESAKPAPKKDKVTLCHATSSATNPYVRITVAPEAVYTQGHDQHQDGRDIIPPFSYDDNGTTRQYPGKNWDSESQAIFTNGCRPQRPETGPASLSATVTFCAALGGGQYIRTTATVQDVLQRDAGAGDIIPPFTYSDGAARSFAGRNWSASARGILDVGCVAPIPTTPSAPVEPVVTCINVNDDGSYSAVFGYRNPNAVSVGQPVGSSNAVTLDANAQGATVGTQPTTFLPGALDVALTVNGIGEDGSVTWTIAAPGAARSATATGASPRCAAPATTPEVSIRAECVIDQGNGTYAARFGYQSDETTTVSVPAGALNGLTQSGGGALGQVQVVNFAPGLNASAFTVTGVRASSAVTWRVITGATARTATASLTSVPSCFAPVVPPTGSTPTGPTADGGTPPYQVPNPGPGGNVTCGQLGYSQSSGRINYSDAGFAQSFSRQGITVSVSGGTYVTWSTAFPVGAVIVKGGPRANVYQYSPGRFGDRGLASPVNSSGNPAGLSNLTVCWNPGAPGPDPNAPTSNPESTPTPPPPPGTPPGTTPTPSPLAEPNLPEPIGVTVACVKKNTDGSFDAVFGYTNPNQLSVTVAGGPANYVAEAPGEPESQLRGQPTSFLPGTTGSAFIVSGVPGAKTVTWTVAYYGTRQATADINFPVSCGLVRAGDPQDVSPNTPSTPTPPVDPSQPGAPIPTPPTPVPPTPATAQLGAFISCATVGPRSYSATFGFTNPAGASLSVPVGPDNRIVGAGSYDRGQPGVFAPGTNAAAFTVTGIPLGKRPVWEVRLPNGQLVSAAASPSAPRCAATSRTDGPGLTTTIATPERRQSRTRVKGTVRVSNPGTLPLYDVEVVIPTPPNTSAPTSVLAPPGCKCATPISTKSLKGMGEMQTSGTTICRLASVMPGASPTIRITSRAGAPGVALPRARAAAVGPTGSALTAVDTTPLTVFARGAQPVTG